ncbi:fructose-1,6-bisphosphatase precursor [Chondrus crispus]|uniref:fructose-bisphosphatase n=1 Tax=Chondrus crispus TaxID=2769 RepID=R7Q4Q2_CHOCR|nr:fructose-1,6-bisphosphatase precursor [Chondrus crispus]CDF33502.1 fructose-1,6-bisphosphatase precursor [Chondrus crispus]|eukprot:XP_005713305.1 fructose-1,6-bisphosphatase precursor [Chondrus crispus]
MAPPAFVPALAVRSSHPHVSLRNSSSRPASRAHAARTARTAPRMVVSPPKQTVHQDTSPMTLTRYMIQSAMDNTDLEHMQDMQSLMSSIQLACKKISSLVQRAGISNLTGLEDGGGSVNVQGEEQKKLDVLSNEVLKNALRYSGKMGIIASEEEDEPVVVDEVYSGNYVAVFDPLDGSSNIDAGIATGTIFGIFVQNTGCLASDWESKIDESELTCLYNTMQPGSNLVAAGYCMYSSSCMMVLTTGHGVNGFTLDPQIGEFVLTHPDMKIPERGNIYSFNEANEPAWDPILQKYVQNLKTGQGQTNQRYSSRYIGSLVADVHRTILYGGVFGYPGDAKNPNGKLRLLYECAPMSFIVEQAGGIATTGKDRIMDIIPNAVHQRMPLIIGSKDDVQELVDMYAAAEE